MASYEKIIKYVIENFQEALTPLNKIVQNQEIIIKQNAEMQEILNKIYQRNSIHIDEKMTRSDNIDTTSQNIEQQTDSPTES